MCFECGGTARGQPDMGRKLGGSSGNYVGELFECRGMGGGQGQA